MYTVYCHTCQKNGKRYVGITKNDPEARWNGGKGYKDQTRFQKAIKEFGWDGFDHEILATGLTKEEAQKTEQYYINEFDSISSGYNMRPGGTAPEPTFLSKTLTSFRTSVKRKKYWRFMPGLQDYLDALSKADKDKETSELWNAMGENALSATMCQWDRPRFDDVRFLDEFILNLDEEVKILKWILNGCMGDLPVRKPAYVKIRECFTEKIEALQETKVEMECA